MSGRSQGVKKNKKNFLKKSKEKRKGTVTLKEGATQQERQKGNEKSGKTAETWGKTTDQKTKVLSDQITRS